MKRETGLGKWFIVTKSKDCYILIKYWNTLVSQSSYKESELKALKSRITALTSFGFNEIKSFDV